MSVGIGMLGREVQVTVGGLTLLGVISKSLTFNNEPLDTTDDQSNGWQERYAKSGVKSIEFGMSGTLKNLELAQAYHGTSQIYAINVVFPDGTSTPSEIDFDGFMDSFSITGEANGLFTYDATFSSSGESLFTSAT